MEWFKSSPTPIPRKIEKKVTHRPFSCRRWGNAAAKDSRVGMSMIPMFTVIALKPSCYSNIASVKTYLTCENGPPE